MLAERLDHPAVPDDSWTTAEADDLPPAGRRADRGTRPAVRRSSPRGGRASVEHWSDVAASQRATSSFVEADRLRDELDAIARHAVVARHRTAARRVAHAPDRPHPVTRAEPLAVRRALAQRLRAAAAARDLVVPEHEDPAADAAGVLAALVDDARSAPTLGPTWLLLVALSAAYPVDADVRATRRRLVLDRPGRRDDVAPRREPALPCGTRIRCSRSRSSAAVSSSTSTTPRGTTSTRASSASCGGTVPLWDRDHDLTLVAWNAGTAYRRLDAERTPPRAGAGTAPWACRRRTRGRAACSCRGSRPWCCPRCPAPHLCAPLAAMAEHSANTLSLVGYDCIPVVSADLMPPGGARALLPVPDGRQAQQPRQRHQPVRGRRVPRLRRHARLAGSGRPAASPRASCRSRCRPPTATRSPAVPARRSSWSSAATSRARTTSPCSTPPSGSGAQGARMRLQLVGGSSWASSAFDARVAELRAAGRDVVVGRAVRDEDLWRGVPRRRGSPSSRRCTRATACPSPSRSASGTPAITSSYGSTEEIARRRRRPAGRPALRRRAARRA